MKLARLKYSFVFTLILSLSIGVWAYFYTSESGIGWLIGIFTILFMFPLIYFTKSKNIKVGKFAYDCKRSNQVLYLSIMNYFDDILYYGGGLVSRTINTSIGGHLYLLKDRLVFQTNLLDYSYRREVIIPVKDIYCISIDSDCPLDKSIIIETEDNKYHFFTGKREEWKTRILRQKAALR